MKEQTKETLKKYVRFLKKRYPDYQYRTVKAFDDGDTVIVAWSLSDAEAEKMQEDILKEFFDIAGKNKEEPPLIVNLKEGVRDDIG